jgi:hypothetical protein
MRRFADGECIKGLAIVEWIAQRPGGPSFFTTMIRYLQDGGKFPK